MAEIRKRVLTEAEHSLLLEQATKRGFTISEKGDEFGGGKTVVVTHKDDPQYYGWFQRFDNYYAFFEREGATAKLSGFDTDESTEGGGKTMREITQEIKGASMMAPEEVTVEPGAKVPEKFADPKGAATAEPREEPVPPALPEPGRKTPEEMKQNPKEMLDQRDIPQPGERQEKGSPGDQGVSTSVPRTMTDVSKAIKGASA